MSPIWLLFILRVRLERLRRFTKGDNRDSAPMPPISLPFRLRVRLERLRRFTKGDNRDSALMSPIYDLKRLKQTL